MPQTNKKLYSSEIVPTNKKNVFVGNPPRRIKKFVFVGNSSRRIKKIICRDFRRITTTIFYITTKRKRSQYQLCSPMQSNVRCSYQLHPYMCLNIYSDIWLIAQSARWINHGSAKAQMQSSIIHASDRGKLPHVTRCASPRSVIVNIL